MMRTLKTALLLLLTAATMIGCGGGPVDEVDSSDAQAQLESLPVVAEWKQQAEASGAKAVFILDRTPDQCRAAGDVPAWEMTLATVTDTGTVTWNRFQVDSAGGEVGVWVAARKGFIPLLEWGQPGM